MKAVALVRGNLNGKTAPLVRVHSQCLTGDVLGVAAVRLSRAARTLAEKNRDRRRRGFCSICRRKAAGSD